MIAPSRGVDTLAQNAPVLLFGTLLVAGTLNNAEFNGSESIGRFAIGTFLFLSLIGLSLSFGTKKLNLANFGRVIFFAFALLSSYLFSFLLSDFSSQSYTYLAQLTLTLSLFIFMSSIEWSRQRIWTVSALFALYSIFHLGLWLIGGARVPFESIFLNPNVLGAVAFFFSFPLLASFAESKGLAMRYCLGIAIASSVLLTLVSFSRSSWVSMLAVGITLIVWKTLARSRGYYTAYISFTFAILIAFTIIYPNLAMDLELRSLSNTEFLESTGKQFFSGRENIWMGLLDAIWERPLFGHGAGALPRDVLDTNLSAHNLYLQLGLQAGLIGLACFFALVFSIWMLYWRARKDVVVQIAAAFLIATLVHQVFEVCLFQNNLSIGLAQWLIISIGVSRAVRYNDPRENELLCTKDELLDGHLA